MLYKESAIAVMVAIMLGAASLFGGLSIAPALATHDSDAVELATEQITQDDDSVVIEAIEVGAKKLNARVVGTITVEIIQGGNVLESASFEASSLKTSYSTVEVDIANINMTGSFEILAEFEGSGVVTVNHLGIVEGTTVAEDGTSSGSNNDDEDSDGNTENESPSQPETDLENVIATKTINQDDGDSMNVEVVEFSAKKLNARTSGTITVALVQENEVLDEESFSTSSVKTSYTEMEATFDENIAGDFDVVFMFDGSGVVTISGINVPGATEPAGEEPTTTPNNPDGTITLTIDAVDESSNEITGMWIEVYEGTTTSGTPITGTTEEVFELEAGDYVVAMGEFETTIFQRWSDGETDRVRTISLQQDTALTAVYSTDGTQPTDSDSDSNPLPTGGPGSIAVYAYRIPSEHWGPTFVSAGGATMWFTLHNSTGWMIDGHGSNENGYTFTGLNDDEQYWLMAHGCDECHGSTHDVDFTRWEDGSTEMGRLVAPGTTASAYFSYDPDP